MYESPVKISFDEEILKVTQEADNQIIATIQQLVSVDKDELIRALQYDRGQYEKGYEDGKRDEVRHGEWEDNKVAFYRVCSECGCGVRSRRDVVLLNFIDHQYYYCPNCGAKMDGKESGDGT